MNSIISSFNQIKQFAKEYGLPAVKKKAIIREYLQVKILDLIYQNPISLNIYFVGGTSLRLLRNLDRFSEDLDFDCSNIQSFDVKNLMDSVYEFLLKEYFLKEHIFLYYNKTKKRQYFELRFKKILYDLNISKNKDEKLVIKFDFENYWKEEKKETILLRRYGYLANIITIPINQILVQKLLAFVNRKEILLRDIYDIVWLYAQGAKIDKSFAKKNKLDRLLFKVKDKYAKNERKLFRYEYKLKPFLLDGDNVKKIYLFKSVLLDL